MSEIQTLPRVNYSQNSTSFTELNATEHLQNLNGQKLTILLAIEDYVDRGFSRAHYDQIFDLVGLIYENPEYSPSEKDHLTDFLNYTFRNLKDTRAVRQELFVESDKLKEQRERLEFIEPSSELIFIEPEPIDKDLEDINQYLNEAIFLANSAKVRMNSKEYADILADIASLVADEKKSMDEYVESALLIANSAREKGLDLKPKETIIQKISSRSSRLIHSDAQVILTKMQELFNPNTSSTQPSSSYDLPKEYTDRLQNSLTFQKEEQVKAQIVNILESFPKITKEQALRIALAILIVGSSSTPTTVEASSTTKNANNPVETAQLQNFKPLLTAEVIPKILNDLSIVLPIKVKIALQAANISGKLPGGSTVSPNLLATLNTVNELAQPDKKISVTAVGSSVTPPTPDASTVQTAPLQTQPLNSSLTISVASSNYSSMVQHLASKKPSTLLFDPKKINDQSIQPILNGKIVTDKKELDRLLTAHNITSTTPDLTNSSSLVVEINASNINSSQANNHSSTSVASATPNSSTSATSLPSLPSAPATPTTLASNTSHATLAPSTRPSTLTPSTTPKVSNQDQIYKDLTSNYQFSPLQASAIMGDWQVESYNNPKQLESNAPGTNTLYSTLGNLAANNKIGYGLAQWTPANKLPALMQQFDISVTQISTLAGQIGTYVQELHSPDHYDPNVSYLSKLDSETSPADAALMLEHDFERPGAVDPRVGQYATEFYNHYTAGQPLPSTIAITYPTAPSN